MSEPSPSKEELDRLLKAAKDGNISDLHYLLEDKKWDVNTRGPNDRTWYNRTLLLITARHAQLEAFKLLLTKGADIHAKDTYDYAALHCAAAGGDSTIVKELIKSGLDVNAIDKYQVTPLHVAAEYGHHEVFQLLLTAGAKLDMVDKDNWTTLHNAAIRGDTAIVKECIKSGLDVNAINDEWRCCVATRASIALFVMAQKEAQYSSYAPYRLLSSSSGLDTNTD
ncbi:ankyrin repeat domain-containing protein 1-like [Dysidea avara]|uniref:ankyrin repeat domain-containing protein 1-like n=1 Tax=Dysidea avara TaxID=196820 RepID=UPI00333192FE